MTRACVAGASGYLGSYLVRELKKKGYWVRVLTRNIERLGDMAHIADDIVVAEVTEPSTLHGACRDVDVLLSTVGITKQKDGLTFMEVDYQANINLLDEALKSGVKKFVYVSVFNAGELAHVKSVQAKLRFGEALAASGIDYSVIYPNGFFSDMQEYLTMARKGRGYVFGFGMNRMNPIHGADLAEVCVRAIREERKEIPAGGPDILTQKEILHLAFAATQNPVKISRIPAWIGWTSLSLLRLFSSVKTYGPAEFFLTVLSRDMIAPSYGTRHLADFYEELATPSTQELSSPA